MTIEQMIMIRKYIDGAYPLQRQRTKEETADADMIWFDMLKDEDYNLCMQGVKNYIRSANNFPPSISAILEASKEVVLQYNNKVIELMESEGYFNDSETTPLEISAWNKENRRRKAQIWASNNYPKELIPDWFKTDYQRYEVRVRQTLIPSAARMMIANEKAVASH